MEESMHKRGKRFSRDRFWPNTRYLDVYKGIQSEILSTTRFDETSDLSTTYLGKSDSSKDEKINQRNPFPHQSKGTC